mgnify:CR=1 FL=1
MARILRTDRDNGRVPGTAIGPVFVKGIRYTNSSSKFWCGLIEEITRYFPRCTDIELSSSVSDTLNHELLFPEAGLERDFKRLLFADIEAEMKKTIAELEILGPPPAVHIRLLSHADEIVSRDLPLDIIDAEIFSCLVVWPLKWSAIPESRWNDAVIKGSVRLEERRQRRVYGMSFTMEKQPLSEGLFRRLFVMKHSLNPYSSTAKTAAP